MKRTFLILFCLSISFIGQSQTSGDNNRNINYYYADGKTYYWQDDSTSANIIVANKHNYDTIVQRLLNIFNENEVVYDNEDDNIIINSENLPDMDKNSLIGLISVENNDISFFSYSKLVNGEHLWLRNEVYVSFSDTAYFRKHVKPILNNYSVLSYNYEDYNEFRIVCADEWDMMLLANTVAKMEGVEYSTPDFYSNIATNANDAFYNDQWGVNNTGQYEYASTVGVDINADLAWAFLDNNVANISNNIKVAVVDDGVEPHEDFYYDGGVCKVLDGYTANGDGTGRPRTSNAHGQCCAGIIGAVHNNIGTAGIAPKSLIVPFRIIKNNGKAFSNARIANAINKAWNEFGTDVLSCSWRLPVKNSKVTNAIRNALVLGRNGKGCIVVFATGNDNVSSVAYPANSDHRIIAVGAISPCGERKSPESCDNKNWGSNYGADLDVVAPGVFISTIDRSGNYGYNYSGKQNDYSNRNYIKFFSGTSAACPHVAGVAALVLSVNPNLTSSQVKNIIEQTAQKIENYSYSNSSAHPNGTWNNQVGYGLVDAYAAILKVALDVDLYTKDNELDNGNEPLSSQISGGGIEDSPDIWLRRNADNGTEHQLGRQGAENYIYIRIHNRGEHASFGNDTVKLYIKKAGLDPDVWSNGWSMIGKTSIPQIASGGSAIVRIDAVFPSYSIFPFGSRPDIGFAMLTRIESEFDELYIAETTTTADNVTNNNNISYDNVTMSDAMIVDDGIVTDVVIAALDNPTDGLFRTSLTFSSPANEEGNPLFEEAEIRLIFPKTLVQSWGSSYTLSGAKKINDSTFLIKAADAKLENISLPANYEGYMMAKVNFLTEEYSEKDKYEYIVEQADPTTGEYQNGLVMIVDKTLRSNLFMAEGGNNVVANANTPANLSATAIGEDAVYNWYDASGTLVNSGQNISVTSSATQKYTLEVIAKADGYKDYDSVYVIRTLGNIVAISPNPTSGHAVVTYNLASSVSAASIVVTNSSGLAVYSSAINVSATTHTLNVQNLVAGQYSVRLLSATGEVLDTKTLLVQ